MGTSRWAGPLAVLFAALAAIPGWSQDRRYRSAPGRALQPAPVSPRSWGPVLTPEPIMDLSFRAEMEPTPAAGQVKTNPAPREVEPVAFDSQTVEQTPMKRPAMSAEPFAASENITPRFSEESKPTESKAAEPSEPERFSLHQIPRSAEGRKLLARQLLADARQHMKAGRYDAAETIVYRVRELAVRYNSFEDNPDKLFHDLAKSQNFGSLLFEGL